jgi:hypothetical protein
VVPESVYLRKIGRRRLSGKDELIESTMKAMFWMKTRPFASVLCAVTVAGTGGAVAVEHLAKPAAVWAQPQATTAARSPTLSAEQFAELQALVRPLPGEYAWRDEIPWLTRIQTARAKAVAEDKPILILASANAFALGRT